MTAQLQLQLAPTEASPDFETLVLPLADNLYGAAMRLARDPTEAEDLVQDTMVRAFRFQESFQPGTNIKAWMFKILRNTFINGYHKRGRTRSGQQDVSAHVHAGIGSAAAVGTTTADMPGPEEALSATTTREAIRAAMHDLPADYRLAVTLADLEGLSYKECAAIMECPIGTVMSRIYRGRKMLHKALWSTAKDLGMVKGDQPAERPSTRGTTRAAAG